MDFSIQSFTFQKVTEIIGTKKKLNLILHNIPLVLV